MTVWQTMHWSCICQNGIPLLALAQYGKVLGSGHTDGSRLTRIQLQCCLVIQASYDVTIGMCNPVTNHFQCFTKSAKLPISIATSGVDKITLVTGIRKLTRKHATVLTKRDKFCGLHRSVNLPKRVRKRNFCDLVIQERKLMLFITVRSLCTRVKLDPSTLKSTFER